VILARQTTSYQRNVRNSIFSKRLVKT